MNCGYYRTEDGCCDLDDGLCKDVECMFYVEPDPEDQGDPFEHSTCIIIEGDNFMAFQCTMPEWV